MLSFPNGEGEGLHFLAAREVADCFLHRSPLCFITFSLNKLVLSNAAQQVWAVL